MAVIDDKKYAKIGDFYDFYWEFWNSVSHDWSLIVLFITWTVSSPSQKQNQIHILKCISSIEQLKQPKQTREYQEWMKRKWIKRAAKLNVIKLLSVSIFIFIPYFGVVYEEWTEKSTRIKKQLKILIPTARTKQFKRKLIIDIQFFYNYLFISISQKFLLNELLF